MFGTTTVATEETKMQEQKLIVNLQEEEVQTNLSQVKRVSVYENQSSIWVNN